MSNIVREDKREIHIFYFVLSLSFIKVFRHLVHFQNVLKEDKENAGNSFLKKVALMVRTLTQKSAVVNLRQQICESDEMNGGKKIIGYLKFAVYEEREGLMKNYIFLFGGLLILFFLSPCFVSFIISTPSPIGFITVDQQEAWISFYGSLLGGILTLLGVGWTIFSTDLIRKKDQKKHEEEIKKEYERRDMEIKKSLSVQYKPILNISFNSDFITDKPFGVSTYKGFYIQNDISLSNEIELKKRIAISLFVLNIGRGEARKLKIESKVISANGEQWKNVTREYEELYISNGISINFYKILSEKEWKQYENNVLAQPVRMYFRIVYEDLVGYKHSLKSFVSIKKFIHIKNENNELIPDVLFLNPYDSIIQNVTSSKEDYE